MLDPRILRSAGLSRIPLLLALMLAGCQAQLPPPPVLSPSSPQALRKSVEYLASDDLEGRGPGTAGLDEAGTYIAGYFRGLGLRPAPAQHDYLQPFTYTTIAGLAPQTALDAGSLRCEAGKDFTAYSFSAEKSFAGPVAFVGYGISGAKDLASKEYDDYAGADVRGKVALVFRFEPHDANGQSRFQSGGWSPHASLETKAKLAAEHGAVALMVVHPPKYHGPESFAPLSRRLGEGLSIPVIQVRQHVAEQLLREAGARDLFSFQSQLDDRFSGLPFVLQKVQVSGAVAFDRSTCNLRNVTGFLPGTGRHANQYIVIGAHYDHLGRGGFGSLARDSKEIHHGADDNASGTAAMLELARIFSQAKPLPRSILFVAFSGEEQGLLGSKYWVEHPPVPLDRIYAMINLDMVGRLKGETLLVGGSATAAPFPRILQEADDASPLGLKSSWQNGVAPSDNTSFVLRRIPVLMFWTGMHPDYHRPSDTADKINYDGEANVVDLVARVVGEIARRNDIRFVAIASTQPGDPALRPGGASLGIVPDYSEGEGGGGVKITGTVPGSPAEKAGLKSGDVLVGIDQTKIETIYDPTDALNVAVPGKPARLHILRDGQRLTVDAILAQRRNQN